MNNFNTIINSDKPVLVDFFLQNGAAHVKLWHPYLKTLKVKLEIKQSL